MIINQTSNTISISQPQAKALRLATGQVTTAQVLQVDGDKALISLAGLRLSARSRVPLLAGQSVNLKVKEVSGGQILLAIIPEDQPDEQEIKAFLLRLGFRADAKTIHLAKILHSAGSEVNKVNLTALFELFPSEQPTPSQSVVLTFMLKNRIPLTKANFSLFCAYLQPEQDWASLFAEGFDPAKPKESLADQLIRLVKSPLLRLLKPGVAGETASTLGTGLKLLSQEVPFLFIPIHGQGQMHSAYLTIQGGGSGDELELSRTLKLTFDLETQNLGHIQIQLTIFEDVVDCLLSTDPGLGTMMQESLAQLKEGLDTLGYTPRSFIAYERRI